MSAIREKNKNVRKKKIRKKRKIEDKKDLVIYISVILLVLIGIVMVFSASSYYALYEKGDVAFFFKKEILWAAVGLICMAITIKIDYHFYRKFTKVIYVLTFLLLIAVLIIGVELNGAKRWIHLGPLSLQPSEIAKYAVVFYLAAKIDINRLRITKFWNGAFRMLFMAGLFAFLVLLEKNLSITAVIMIVAFIMLYVGGANEKILFFRVAPFGAIVGFILIRMSDYRWARMTSFLDPWKDASQDGYQLVHSLMAIATGGFTGEGLGRSMQKALYMPEPHNDFIFAIIAEEFGIFGCIAVIGIFVALILSALSVADRAKDNYGRLIATGITSVIASQALINIAVVTGSMPVTGVPLPFISYGGTSLVINLAAMGVLLNISKQAKSKKDINQ